MKEEDLEHLAFSIAHGTFDSGTSGGCSCTLCRDLVRRVDELQKNEAAEFYNEHYPPPGGFL